jgi:hypothetical protein
VMLARAAACRCNSFVLLSALRGRVHLFTSCHQVYSADDHGLVGFALDPKFGAAGNNFGK